MVELLRIKFFFLFASKADGASVHYTFDALPRVAHKVSGIAVKRAAVGAGSAITATINRFLLIRSLLEFLLFLAAVANCALEELFLFRTSLASIDRGHVT